MRAAVGASAPPAVSNGRASAVAAVSMIDVRLAGGRLVSIAPDESFMSNSDLTLSIMLGVGLAAATGFRVFLPMLIVSVTSYTGHLSLGDSFAWLGTPAALTMLGAAALAEIAAYYIPGVDNLLDALATPAAFVAGTIVSAAVMTDLPPMVKWTAAIIAGAASPASRKASPQRSGQIPPSLRAESATWFSQPWNSVVHSSFRFWPWPRRSLHSRWSSCFCG